MTGWIGKALLLLSGAIVLAVLVAASLEWSREDRPVFDTIQPEYVPILENPESIRVFRMKSSATGQPAGYGAAQRVGSGVAVDAAWGKRLMRIFETRGDRNKKDRLCGYDWDVVADFERERQKASVFVWFDCSQIGLGFGQTSKLETLTWSDRAMPDLKVLFEDALGKSSDAPPPQR